MQKHLALCGVLLSVGSCFASSFVDEGIGGYDHGNDPYSSMMMMGMLGSRKESFVEAVDRGIKFGIVRGVSGVTGKALETGMSGAISGITSTFGAIKKAFLRSMFNNSGFDVREVLGWRDMLESSVNANMLDLAKGARVVRAHVLSQEIEDQAQGQSQVSPLQKLHAIEALKSDMAYIVSRLDTYEKFYAVCPNHQPRGMLNRVLDGIALAGIVYAVTDSFAVKKDALAVKKDALREFFDGKKPLQDFLKGQESSHNDGPLRMVEFEPINAKIASLMNDEAAKLDELCYASAKLVKIGFGAFACELHPKTAKGIIKTGLCLFAAVRLAQWLKSQEAVRVVVSLSQNNREFVVHLIGSLRNNLTYLIGLCDTVKEESDLVRVKDDFEFISKNCRNMLLQIANLVDQNESIAIQRIGKSGQGQMQPGFGGLGGLPKI